MTSQKFALLGALSLLSITLRANGLEQDADGSWKVSISREFSRSPDRWTGLASCVNSHDNYYVPADLAKNEAAKRQVDCKVDAHGNAVCANSFEGTPRTGAFDPLTREIITTQIYIYRGEQQPCLYVFKIKLDQQKNPVSATTFVHFGLFRDWPKNVAHDDVLRKDLIHADCTAEFETKIGPASSPYGETPEAQAAEQAFIKLGQNWLSQKRSLNTGPGWTGTAGMAPRGN